jgi:4-amino-4-deoxy-L-arabinose transferase-like glycosyltransferase
VSVPAGSRAEGPARLARRPWGDAAAAAAGAALAILLGLWERRRWSAPLGGADLLVYLVTIPLVTWLAWRVCSAVWAAAWAADREAGPPAHRAALDAAAAAVRHPAAALVLAAVLVAVRLLHLAADPPVDLGPSGGAWTDPGEWAHNARNKVLFGEWVWDEVNFMYLSPLVNLCFYLVFRLAGVGYPQVGLVSAAFGLATLAVFHAALRESWGRGGALLATTFLGGSFLFVTYNRVGLMETPAVFFQVLALYFGQRGVRDPRFFAACGAASLAPVAVKMQLAYIVPAALLAVIGVCLGGHAAPPRRRSLRPLGWFLVGVAAMAVLLAAVWLAPHWEPIRWRLENESRLHTLPMTLPRLLGHVFHNPFVAYFGASPALLLPTVVAVCVLLLRLLRGRAIAFPHLFALWWFLGGFSLLAIVQYRPLRYYVSLVPPMAIFAAAAALGLWRSRRLPPLRPPGALSVWVVAVALFLVGSTVGGYAYARLAPVQEALARLGLYPLTDRERALLIGAAALVAGAAAFRLLGPRVPGLASRLPAWAPRALAAALVGLFVVTEGGQYLDWKLHRGYKLVSVSRELGARLPPGSVLAGIFAPVLTLENGHRSLAIWDRYGNWRGDPLVRYGVTHVLVMAYIDEIGYYHRRFPDAMRQARLLDEWILWKTRVSLYELPRRRAGAVRERDRLISAVR